MFTYSQVITQIQNPREFYLLQFSTKQMQKGGGEKHIYIKEIQNKNYIYWENIPKEYISIKEVYISPVNLLK